MRITDVEAVIVKQHKEIEMIGDGSQDTVVILVHTEEGITGAAEVDSSPYGVKAVIEMPDSHMVCRGLREIVVGEDAFDVEKIWRKMYQLKLIVCFPMPILVSLLINELRRARVKKTIQTVVYIPNFVSWVIAAGLWYSLLGNSGVVNSLLMGLGITQEPVMFMQSLGWFYPVILFTDLWKTLGYNTIFYMAAMSGISTEQYEAAMMDGAGRFKQAIYITLPSISKTIVLMFILQVGSLMSAGFDQMWTMSNLATRELSDILDTAVLRTLTSGTINDLSVGAAMGLFKSAISLGLFMVTNFLADKFDQGSLV